MLKLQNILMGTNRWCSWDEAAATADTLSDLLAKATTDRAENSSARVIRDQAYTYIKQAVDEVRACGRFTFKTPKVDPDAIW